MKKLALAAMTAISLLLPKTLNSSDTIKKDPETKVLVNLMTGETLRIKVGNGSYWSWINEKLSEELDSAAVEIENTKTTADTLYRPNLYSKGGGSPEGIEIVYHPKIRELLRKLDYTGEESWGEVGKRILTAWKRNHAYDTSNVITFEAAMGGSAICLPYAIVMYTCMKNEGFDPRYVEIQEGWFKESGDEDSIIVLHNMYYIWHAAVYLNGVFYDNEAAYPAGEGDERGFVCADEYLQLLVMKNWWPDPWYGWVPAIFLLSLKDSPWDVTWFTNSDTNHPFYRNFVGEDVWIMRGLDQIDMGGYTIVYDPQLEEAVKEMTSYQK